MRLKFKQLNYMLSSGLCVVNAKFKKNSQVATLCVSNFSEATRLLFDMESKKILSNRDNISILEKDIEGLMTVLMAPKI